MATRPAPRPDAFVADLLPIGSLSATGGLWTPSGSAPLIAPRNRPRATAPPRFGVPEGYVPLGGVYW